MKASLLVSLAIIACGLTAGAQDQNNQAAAEKGKPLPLEFQVQSVTTATNVSAYVGDGASISKTFNLPFGEDGMNSIIMQKESDGQTYTYMAGEVTANTNGLLLVVKCAVNNVTETNVAFLPIDVGIGDKQGSSLVALGLGRFPFAKDKAGWDKVKKSGPAVIPAHESRSYIYVFGVSKGTSSWTLTYKERRISELKETSE